MHTCMHGEAVRATFTRSIQEDLRVVRHVGWQRFLHNLKVQTRKSVLGYTWLLLPSLLAALVWVGLGRAQVLKVDNSGVPYPVVVLAGLFLWQGFVEALNFPLQHIQAAKTTLAKVRVPHDAFVAAGMGLVIFNSALRLLILLAAMLWFQVPLTGLLFLVPLGVASRFVLGLALGWLVAVLGLLFSDVANALGMVINLWFLVTPVVYSLPAAANKWLILNPVTPLLTTTRQWLLAGPFVPTPGFWQITVIAYLLRIIAEHKEANCDLWYRDAHFVYYFFTRAYFSGIHKLEPLRQPIIERILASARPDGHLGDTLTDTAWVVSSLLNLRSYPPELTAATRYLLAAQQATGEWPRWLLYYGGGQTATWLGFRGNDNQSLPGSAGSGSGLAPRKRRGELAVKLLASHSTTTYPLYFSFQ